MFGAGVANLNGGRRRLIAAALHQRQRRLPELQELLPDNGVAAPDDPVMQELAPLVAAVQTLPPVTRQQLVQLWQATLQLVQGGSNQPPPAAVQVSAAGAEHYETTTYY